MRSDPRALPPGLHHVNMEAVSDGLVLTLDIEHHYANPSDETIEVVISLPIPPDAIVLDVETHIDGQPVPTTLVDRETAEGAYEAALEARTFAALVERSVPGICAVSLGPLPPGRVGALRLRLGLILDVAHGRARIVAPSVVVLPEGTSRAAAAGPLGASPVGPLAEYPLRFALRLIRGARAANATSPTHKLSVARSEHEVLVTLAEAAALDRDVVIVLDGLASLDGLLVANDSDLTAVVGFTPPRTVSRQPLHLAILIDAAGPLGPVLGELEEVLSLLAAGLEDGDRVSVAKLGRTLSPRSPTVLKRGEAFDFVSLGGAAADLGDVPIDGELPSLTHTANADILYITDGRTRAAERLIDRVRSDGRRLFVLGIGASPDAGWLRPAALETGGDYVGLAPEEAPEWAVANLLDAMTAAPATIAPPEWDASPSWTAKVSPWRPGRRCTVCAGFDNTEPHGVAVRFSSGDEAFNPPRIEARGDRLAEALVRIAAAQRLGDLTGTEAEAWARRFNLAAAGARLMSLSPAKAMGADDDIRLVHSPQMLPAGWRGVGSTSPSPPRPPGGREAPPEAPMQRARRIPSTGAFLAAVLAVFVAGGGTWFALRPPPTGPVLASLPDHFPNPSASRSLPLQLSAAPDNGSEVPGHPVGQPKAEPATQADAGRGWSAKAVTITAMAGLILAALGLAALIVTDKLRRRRRSIVRLYPRKADTL